MSSLQQELLKAEQLSAGYGGQAVVSDLNISVKRGEIVCLFGANGAGKTTTLLSLAGELPALQGSVALFGSVTRAPLYQRVREGMQFITDERSLIFSLTVKDNLQVRGASVARALEIFPELEPHLQRPAALLSGGQQQMVAVARALAAQPRLLLVDELSMGLAPQIVARLLHRLRRAADDGVGILLVEQHVTQALEICDRGVVLSQGKIVFEGSAERLKEQSRLLTSSYLGGH